MNAQQTTQISIVKQATINCLPLPDLVLAEIKDYLFYDPQAYKQIQHTRKQKSLMLKLIKSGLTSDKIYEYQVINYKCYKRIFDSPFYTTSSFIMNDNSTFEDYLHYMDFNYDTFLFNVQYKIGSKRHYVSLQRDFCRQCGDYKPEYVQTFQGDMCSEKCKCKCAEYM